MSAKILQFPLDRIKKPVSSGSVIDFNLHATGTVKNTVSLQQLLYEHLKWNHGESRISDMVLYIQAHGFQMMNAVHLIDLVLQNPQLGMNIDSTHRYIYRKMFL